MSQTPPKAYKNLEFLNSPAARHLRILAEYEEPRQRFLRQGVKNTIVFFGSARIRSRPDAMKRITNARELLDQNPDDPTHKAHLERAEAAGRLTHYYEGAMELARRLTEWSMNREGKRSYYVTSGGGPGIMEAANRGASEVPGGRSVGLGISLPFEQGVNEWVTPELAFEFHYFFTRKLWFLYYCKGLVVFPGGFGTMDELFETLTLVQTGKIKKRLPIILFGSEYWNKIFDLSAMAEFGTISRDDLDLLHVSDSVDEAFTYLTGVLEEVEAGKDPHQDEGAP